ncbi:sugar ABC transporter substrate-binding protein [Capsulimonas corticalis]|uniref:Sugar ABC transporter substrate-binding protein n=1 Tax=Capsulimonas corticalis TaxID=2219043 RepID=A0A402CVI6_9BACT|nr:sugar ABC transporter substrate-binding protein [Capsulimonas corticalis]BDI30414.1 sugar ABC transporter substrate-binding protein [Capsulimonas corticalis]
MLERTSILKTMYSLQKSLTWLAAVALGGAAVVGAIHSFTSIPPAVSAPLAALPANRVRGDVVVWSWSPASDSLEAINPGFQKRDPHVHVKIVTGARMVTRLMLSLSAGVGAPDVTQLQRYDAPHYIATEQFEDLTQVAQKYQALFPKSVWNDCVMNGRVYAIPWDIGPCAVYYKKDLFAKYGVDPSTIHTWDDYIAAGQVILKKSGGRTKMLSMGSTALSNMYEMLIQQSGGQMFDDRGRIAVDTPQSRQALEVISKIVHSGISANIQPFGPEYLAGFNSDSLATYVNAVWLEATMKGMVESYPGPKAQWGVFRLPSITPGGPYVSSMGGSVLAIPKQCKNKAAAWAYIEYALCTTEGQLGMYEKGIYPGLLPALQDKAMDEPDKFFGGQPVGRLFATDVDKMNPLNRTGDYGQANRYITQALSQWYSNGAPDQDILGPLAQRMSRALDRPIAPVAVASGKTP